MKKIVAILLAVLMMIPAFALGENVVKIGVFEPASSRQRRGRQAGNAGHAVRQQRAAHR